MWLWPWQDSKSMGGSTVYNYIFRSHPGGLQILHVKAKELIQYAPLSEMNGAIQMQTK